MVSNPAGVASDQVVRLAADLSAAPATFGGFERVASLQSLAFFPNGTAVLSAETSPTSGAVVFVSGLCEDVAAGCTNPGTTVSDGDRRLSGSATGLFAPKGLVVTGNRLIVADPGNRTLRIFFTGASGNTAAVFVVNRLGAGDAIWDVAYDPDADRLFAAATNGLVLVYDDFLTRQGANGPDRTLTPTDGARQISVNLHGIVYDPPTDVLVVSDIGSATDGSDGQRFTLARASTAGGETAVRYRLRGPATRLGNPADLALTSAGVVYVADKATNRVLRYDDLLTATGTADAAAAASVPVLQPESVALANP